MTVSMVERVAAGQAAFDGRTLIGMSRGERERYFERARIAIADMQEPSHELTWQAVEAVHKFAHGHDVEFYRFHGLLAPDAQRVYQERIAIGFNAILAAALNEQVS